ncbi:hypothetical protein ACPOL_1191 [Acidisarcina polymorpha]|uniref:Uncharacterized protein n=1 Tax=Acidisarcina polymorpha TaxID=2211140 RepID=A0A2Z5FUI4_9BACT|nr:hypothetical protein [Acidisarcina polymorpha]AXC10539.1 hypothetical protein ACPOL_1191 [Acidisarcina polymorpha]
MQTAPQVFGLYTRVHRHIQTLGILWLLYSLFGLLAWLVAMPFLSHFFGHSLHNFNHRDFPLPLSMSWILPFATILVYLRSGFGILVGIGLLRRERWARTLALVVSILTLIKPPFGTALGIYTLWVLLPSQSALEYETVTAP